MTAKTYGYDISHWQSLASGMSFRDVAIEADFLIIKAGGYEGGKYYKDPKFEEYYAAAKKAGIPVGAYFYVDRWYEGAYSALYAAMYFMSLLKGKTFEYPVVLDAEEMLTQDKATNGICAKTFCRALELFGYYACIYGSDVSVFQDMYTLSDLDDFDKWVARYGKEPQVVKSYGLWQFRNDFPSNAFGGNVDRDVAYYDYPTIMKNKHLNGF